MPTYVSTSDGSCCCGFTGPCDLCVFCGECMYPTRVFVQSATGIVSDYLLAHQNASFPDGYLLPASNYNYTPYGVYVQWRFDFFCDAAGNWTFIFSINNQFVDSSGTITCDDFQITVTNSGGTITSTGNNGWSATSTGVVCGTGFAYIPVTVTGPCGTIEFRIRKPSTMMGPPPMMEAPSPAVATSPCAHLGRDLGTAEIVQLGLNPSRRWMECEAGQTKNPLNLAGIVCSCTGCGPTCPKYEAATDE